MKSKRFRDQKSSNFQVIGEFCHLRNPQNNKTPIIFIYQRILISSSFLWGSEDLIYLINILSFPNSSVGKESACNTGNPVRFLGLEGSLEKGVVTHSRVLRLPLWLSWERICLQCGRAGFDPWVGKIPERRESLFTPEFCPGEFHGLYELIYSIFFRVTFPLLLSMEVFKRNSNTLLSKVVLFFSI